MFLYIPESIVVCQQPRNMTYLHKTDSKVNDAIFIGDVSANVDIAAPRLSRDIPA